ncbi:MAG: phenylalanine--tRNA ligase subunit alpha, partial [Liquorilactobacillus satsumensis]
MDLKERLSELKKDALAEITNVDDLKKINDIRVKLLGKKGPITEVLRGMR